MEKGTKIHVGLDVHKDSITVAAAEPGAWAAEGEPAAWGMDERSRKFTRWNPR